VRFDDPGFLLLFLPVLLALYHLTLAAANLPWKAAPAMAGGAAALLLLTASFYFVFTSRFAWQLVGLAVFTYAMARAIEGLRARSETERWARRLVVAAVAVDLAVFALTRRDPGDWTFAPLGVAVLTGLSVAFVVDVYRGAATTRRPLAAALYLVQFPALLAGPIVRFRDVSAQNPRRMAGVGAFTYGTRRLVIGLVKVALIARVLAVPADRIFALPAAKLATDAAWLGMVCYSLQLYFALSGYSDMAIGMARMLGFRYPENFRRPYTADSVRDFWRRWNITLMTWLRDYLYLPIAERDEPAPRLYVNIVFGFCLVGLWHGSGWNVVVWGVYSGMWLALEAVGLGAIIARLPRALRHAYLLAIVMVGWVLLRAGTVPHALAYVSSLAGLGSLDASAARQYLTPQVWFALTAGALGAGPLVPSISRWRVSLDAAVVSVMMMVTATGLFLWRGAALLIASVRSTPLGPSSDPRRNEAPR
jgi:D-alanyl-lipoteichoic acid acyltransferase DltB (MBOAT superfamily)